MRRGGTAQLRQQLDRTSYAFALMPLAYNPVQSPDCQVPDVLVQVEALAGSEEAGRISGRDGCGVRVVGGDDSCCCDGGVALMASRYPVWRQQ